MAEKMIIFSKGLDGNAVYSLMTEAERKPIFTNKGKEEAARNIVRDYPDTAQGIYYSYKNLSQEPPEEIDFSKLNPSSIEHLFEEISKILEKEKKKG